MAMGSPIPIHNISRTIPFHPIGFMFSCAGAATTSLVLVKQHRVQTCLLLLGSNGFDRGYNGTVSTRIGRATCRVPARSPGEVSTPFFLWRLTRMEFRVQPRRWDHHRTHIVFLPNWLKATVRLEDKPWFPEERMWGFQDQVMEKPWSSTRRCICLTQPSWTM